MYNMVCKHDLNSRAGPIMTCLEGSGITSNFLGVGGKWGVTQYRKRVLKTSEGELEGDSPLSS